MKLLERIQQLAAAAPEGGTKSFICAGIVWGQVIFSVLILFIAGILGEVRRRKPRSSTLELPPH